jgi:NDP-sugar pyrophosphorylase family protein
MHKTAMILAAGRGERLRSLTDKLPKALVTVKGLPLLGIVMQRLKYFGFDEIIVNVHHLAEQILSFLHERDNFGLTVHISDERDGLLGTGGALKKAYPLVDDSRPLLIHNVDILSDINLAELYETHLRSQALATLAVKDRKSTRVFLFDHDDRLCGWKHKFSGEVKPAGLPPGDYKERGFSGIQVVGPGFFEKSFKSSCFPVNEDVFSVIDVYLCLAAQYRITGYDPGGIRWLDLGKIEDLEKAGTHTDLLNLY